MDVTITTPEKVGLMLKKYFDAQGMSQQDVADVLGVSQAAVSARLCGIRPFGKNAARKWHDAFGFREVWLLMGEGEMFDDAGHTVTQTINNNSGVAIQQAGNGNNATATTQTHDEGFFTRLCSQLMDEIMKRDERICCLEKQLREQTNGK